MEHGVQLLYSSLKSIPRELREAADINRFSWVQRLVQLELPFAAIGLVWNLAVMCRWQARGSR